MRRILLLVAALLLGACFSSASSAGHYDLYEFAIDGSSVLEAGESVLQLTNSGEFTHTFVVTDKDGVVVAASDVLPAGATAELAIDVEPGDYMVTCRIVVQTDQGQLVDHFEQGMHLNVTVTP